ncbi:formylmethanofuran dehydrogenase subunit B [Methanothrix soehngenii]|uniref:formylmethanofuran dehydrogenase subunit B n=1 Tax=Methanothrix soehngenii TaxID=2223 RepID=UPI002CC4FFF0|nr:formylmethanofuran dehydrogenase subunit B [Methanothrix soehngenii]HOS23030.1 formylmethanofuran dehydrogenase subunit B [Methanothrix soehngenii]HPL21256.1 formylmethanofuran dehydrogenase subunit B [Methanothrix soehngenii]
MVTKNIVCPVCGASCDDIQVELEGQGLTVRNACKMGNAKFQEVVSPHRIKEPLVRVDGDLRRASWDEAIEMTARILANSERPLLFMGSETSTEAMEVGIHMAEFLGGIADSNSTVCHGPTTMGIQEAGRVGATAGQSKSRADLTVYWGSNPLESMPRHMSRYAVYPRGYWTQRGRFDRTVICVDPRRSITAENADLHIQLNPNTDYELLSALLTLLHGKRPHQTVEEVTGVSISEMERMLEMMKSCNYGAIYVGLGIASSYGKHRNAELAFNLVKELNSHTKFVIGALRGHCNVAGFNQIASYLYGFPFGLDFARGYPRYNPGEYTAVDVLREKDVDAAFILSADLVSHFPAACSEYLAQIPVACIDIAPCPTTMLSDVVLPGVIDAMECDGTFYRLDDVPIYFQPFTSSPFSFTESNVDTMNQIFKRVKRIKGK